MVDVEERREVASSPLTARALGALAALAGVVAAIVTLAAAELVALATGSGGSPLLAVGSFVIDIVPPGVKEGVIALFGTDDKVALSVVLLVVVLVLAALAGVLEYRRAPIGTVLLVVVALFALVTVSTRTDATLLDAAPTVVGAVLGVILLRTLTSRLRAWAAPLGRTEVVRAQPRALERRRFLQLAIASGAVALVVGVGARALNAASQAASTARAALKLPKAATPAPAIPAGADLGIDGLSTYITPNAEFYRIDIALQVPSIDPANWSLTITGEVEQEVTISYDELAALPLEEHVTTLTCVSNDVGGDLIGNAVWLGYPIRELLARARPKAGADMVLSKAPDGFTAGTPLSVLQDDTVDAILAIGMNGEPLPLEHGFPVRMVVPGLYGYVSGTKWVTEWEVTTFAAAQGYWTPRGWDAKGPIKLSSRIDVPNGSAVMAAGEIVVAGVAWAQHVGVSAVEVRVDGGAWQHAELAEAVNIDTWVQWSYRWQATSGSHDIEVRATDANGVTQRGDYLPPAPNGSEGWDLITVNVS